MTSYRDRYEKEKAEMERKYVQARDARNKQTDDSVRIGDRNGLTGRYQILTSDGGVSSNGVKTFNANIPADGYVRGLAPSSGVGTSLDYKNVKADERRRSVDENSDRYLIKEVYTLETEQTVEIYIGGDRDPELVYELERQKQGLDFVQLVLYLQNRGQDDWVLSGSAIYTLGGALNADKDFFLFVATPFGTKEYDLFIVINEMKALGEGAFVRNDQYSFELQIGAAFISRVGRDIRLGSTLFSRPIPDVFYTETLNKIPESQSNPIKVKKQSFFNKAIYSSPRPYLNTLDRPPTSQMYFSAIRFDGEVTYPDLIGGTKKNTFTLEVGDLVDPTSDPFTSGYILGDLKPVYVPYRTDGVTTFFIKKCNELIPERRVAEEFFQIVATTEKGEVVVSELSKRSSNSERIVFSRWSNLLSLLGVFNFKGNQFHGFNSFSLQIGDYFAVIGSDQIYPIGCEFFIYEIFFDKTNNKSYMAKNNTRFNDVSDFSGSNWLDLNDPDPEKVAETMRQAFPEKISRNGTLILGRVYEFDDNYQLSVRNDGATTEFFEKPPLFALQGQSYFDELA